ncbi:MAG: hypothetical protein M3430_06390, partial [Acidobacteriota bacterium]|nr:hypothetical protein [Acidobacteriota bacterium]
KTALTTFLLGSVGVEGASVQPSLFYKPTDRQKDIQDGWWVVKKYNCMGCHTVQVGQPSILAGLPMYTTPEGRAELPPGLTTEGARVDPTWLMSFLRDPSLSEKIGGTQPVAVAHESTMKPQSSTMNRNSQTTGIAQATTNAPQNTSQAGALKPQPGENRNGVRSYLKARMPTFSFSPNELRTLVRFFLAVSSQQEPYIKEKLDPLTNEERQLARALFTSQAAPCLKCHITGNPAHDLTASAPNFLQSGERLKPGWTFHWLLDPQRIMPGTSMPSELFKRDGERWVFNGPVPEQFSSYEGDHARLLVRYMLQLTPEEQRATATSSPSSPPSGGNGSKEVAATAHQGLKTPPAQTSGIRRNARGAQRASRATERRGRRPTQISSLKSRRNRRA